MLLRSTSASVMFVLDLPPLFMRFSVSSLRTPRHEIIFAPSVSSFPR
jgi:hypothetical protein